MVTRIWIIQTINRIPCTRLNKKTPIYRLFNPNADGAGSHHYTVNQAERDNLVKLGWKNEDIAFYGA